MTNANPTPGPWRVSRTNAGLFISGAQPGYFCEVYAGNKTSMVHIPEQETNARLIAEAGTVYHETGLTPRQLAEQRAELLEALDGCIEHMEWSTHQGRAAYETAKATIAAYKKHKGGGE